jgi:hypothetical protein
MGIATSYKNQTRFVRGMMRLLASIVEAASQTDADTRSDAAAFAEGTTFVMRVLGSDCQMRLRASGGRLRVIPDAEALDRMPDVEVTFKHIALAYRVFSFTESTAEAFANDRLVTRGDTALAMRLTRCLNRAQSLAIPVLPMSGTTMPIPSRLWNTLRLHTRLVANTLGA